MQRYPKKIVSRFYPILINGLRSVSSPLITILISYIIVNYFSKALWGDFVKYLLFFFITTLVSSWGNKTYLLRSFSENPAQIAHDWQEHFSARFGICLIFSVVIYALYPINILPFLFLWLLSAYISQSFAVIIYYYRDYYKSIFIELVGLICFVFQIFLYSEKLNLDGLIRIYALSQFAKALTNIFFYPSFLSFNGISLNLRVLKLSFPFFVLAISGFLLSKIDIYVFSFFNEKSVLAEYQIISGFLAFSGSMATLVSFPYVKNFYRMKNDGLINFKKLMVKIGIPLNFIITISIFFILEYGFDIRLTILQILLAFFIGLPPYIYTSHIYKLIKKKRENTVIRISIICLVLNLILCLCLINVVNNITSVMLANSISQLCCMIYATQFKLNESH